MRANLVLIYSICQIVRCDPDQPRGSGRAWAKTINRAARLAATGRKAAGVVGKAIPLVGAALTVAGIAAEAQGMQENMERLAYDRQQGNQGFAALDEIGIAVSFQGMTGNYYATYAMLDALWTGEEGQENEEP